MSIVEVPLSNKKSAGSEATFGDIAYHYQKWENLFIFFKNESMKNKKMAQRLCVPNIDNKWMGGFLSIKLTKRNLDESELLLYNPRPKDPSISVCDFTKSIKKCKQRFIVIAVTILWDGKTGAHANIILIDTKKLTIELFEPHGKQTEETTFSGITGGYYIISRQLKQFFKIQLPNFKFITPEYYLSTFNLQQNDPEDYGGLCISWGIMYVYYRILNPTKTQRAIAQHMKKKVNKNRILKFVQYVEEISKQKY